MAATLTTLNVSVEQIEADLRAGKTVADIAQDWSEPPANVYAVQRAMQARGDSNGHSAPSRPPAAAPVASGARPAAGASTPVGSGPSAALTVDALVAAAERSTSKRTQALGVKLHDLAAVVRQRIADERDTAEREAKERAERDAAAAEVERLERQLREARAKLRTPKRQGGGSPVQREKPVAGPFLCSHCGRSFVYAKAHAKHETNCAGAAS